MEKKLNISLLYYKDTNLGDVAICDCTKYIIEKVLKDKDVDYNIECINIGAK